MSMCRSLHLGDLLALVVLEQVDRLLADDAGDRAVARGELDALADEDLRVPAADAGEAQEALVVDVGDDQADLVDVADDRRASGRRRARARARSTVPMTSVRDLGERRAGVARTPRPARSRSRRGRWR